MLLRPLVLAALCSVGFAQNIGPNFVAHFTYVNLGTPLTPLNWGGVNFKPGNPNVLLMGGYAYNSAGVIWEVPIVRGAGGHITGLAGGDVQFSTAPFIDGGLTFAPGNVLLFTSWPSNNLGQLKPGSTVPDRTDLLTTYGVTSSTGGACIVPAGFAGAGRLKLTSYTADSWFDMALTPDGNGTFTPGTASAALPLPGTIYGGPEGIAYVHGGASGIAVDGVVVAEYGEWQVALYDIDSNGDPITATRQVLLDNLVNADGVVLDPSTGDFVVVGQGGVLGVVRRTAAAPVTYCTAGTTTNNCNASMSSTGTPSASATSGFTLTVGSVEGQKQGIIFYGVTGRAATPWGVGGTSLLCVKAPTQRTGSQSSGGTLGACNGSLVLDWNAWRAAHPAGVGSPFAAGLVIDAQGWFRDPPAVKTTSLSNGIEFTLQP